MTIMDVLKKISGNKAESSKKFKDMQEDRRLQNILEQREKSSNERELENYMKREREKKIKEQLDIIHKKQTHDAWKGNLMGEKMNILNEDRPILKEPNIFMNNPNHFFNRGGFL